MKTNYLSDLEKRAIVDIARGLVTRASIEIDPVTAASTSSVEAEEDSISDIRNRIDSLTRQTNARLSKLTASIQYLHKKTAAISGQFDAVRQSLAEIESAFDNERRETSEATSIFIDRLTREVSVGLDGISSVVDATIEAQSQLISIARQIAEGAGAGLNSGDSPVA